MHFVIKNIEVYRDEYDLFLRWGVFSNDVPLRCVDWTDAVALFKTRKEARMYCYEKNSWALEA